MEPIERLAPLRIEGPVHAPDSAPKCAIGGGADDTLDDSADDSGARRRLPPDALVGVVETALARALTLAAEAGRWEIVAQLAEELAARQRAREGISAVVQGVRDKRDRR